MVVGETLSLAGSFDDFSLDEGAMVSIGQCLVGMDRPGGGQCDHLHRRQTDINCSMPSGVNLRGGVDGIRCVNTRALSHPRSV